MTRIRFAGLGAVALFLVMVLRFWHPVYGFTSFLQLGASPDNARIAAFRDRPVYVYPYQGSYDGVSYAQIASHPLLDAPDLRLTVDNLAYRARRIVPPALAWLLARGDAERIVPVYAAVNVLAWLVLAAVLWRLLAVRDARTWLAWAGVLFSAGALASVRLALTDLTALAAIAGAMLALERGRGGWATGWLAVAGLSRETSLLALPGLWNRLGVSRTNLRRTLLAVLPLALWIAYIRWRTGPANQGWDNFSPPFSSFAAKWRAVIAEVQAPPDPLLAWTTLLATASLTVQGLYFAATARRRNLLDPWWRIGAIYAAMMLFLGPAVWAGYPGAATRVLLPMGLAFNVLACRRRLALMLLVAGNLAVPAGLLAMRDTAPHPRDIAAAHAGGVAYVARLGDGWYRVERTLRHDRAWSSGHGFLEIETWPHLTRSFTLEFSTRSLAPRTVTIRQRGQVGMIAVPRRDGNHPDLTPLWRGTVGAEYRSVTVPVEIVAGHATLEFSTGSPGVTEGSDDHTRCLTFNLRDPKLIPRAPAGP